MAHFWYIYLPLFFQRERNSDSEVGRAESFKFEAAEDVQDSDQHSDNDEDPLQMSDNVENSFDPSEIVEHSLEPLENGIQHVRNRIKNILLVIDNFFL